MHEIRILTEKSIEIDCLMETFESDFLFSSFSKSRAIHPRFKFLELLEKKELVLRKGDEVRVSENVLMSSALLDVLKEKELLLTINEFMKSKSFPFIINPERDIKLVKVTLENGFVKNMTLRVFIKEKDEKFIIPFSVSIYEAVFSSINKDDMTCDAKLYFDGDLYFKGVFNFYTQDPETLLNDISKIMESPYVKSYYMEKACVTENKLEVDMIVDLNKFEEDLEDEW